ncbi:41248_t:CDS:2 [Gigaspora margarita]|uniref:41248_t:CDS:1 n=1 Tax=Gigaspora margarita TaxID=4874 RepID=A0ABN7ULL5_GIGMA|nr:41248_t:CDS:2 [Gigaspora margarita]
MVKPKASKQTARNRHQRCSITPTKKNRTAKPIYNKGTKTNCVKSTPMI